MCFKLILLCLKQNTVYLFSLKNKMSEFVTLVFKNKIFLSLISVYVIFSKYRKPAYAILNIVLIFNLLKLIGLLSIIFFRISFVISKYMAFCFRKKFFLSLIISTI